MVKVITLICYKGGVGRSTTTQNVGWKLAELGHRVLLVDLDNQSNLSELIAKDYSGQVVEPKKSISTMLNAENGLWSEYIVDTRHSNLQLLSSSWELGMTERALYNDVSSNTILMDRLDGHTKEVYDYIIFDTTPDVMNKLTHNALVMSDYYWYIQSSENKWSLDSKPAVDKIIRSIKKSLNKKLKPLPVLQTMFSSRNKVSHEIRKIAEDLFEQGLMDTTIRNTTMINKSIANRQTIFEFDRRLDVAKDYHAATEELLKVLG